MMRRALCPEMYCRRPLLYHPSSKIIQCWACREVTRVDLLRGKEAASVAEEMDWINAKARMEDVSGAISRGRSRWISQTIDGISCYTHCLVLAKYFNNYGERNGEAKRLSEMGRMEPIDVTTFRYFAFGIRKEHLDVIGYGQDAEGSRYLRRWINAIDKENDRWTDSGNALVPLSNERRGIRQTAGLVSRACVGREVFEDRLVDETMVHLRQYADEYKKRSNYSDSVWVQIGDPTSNGRVVEIDDLDLAAMANVLCRPIVFLDSEQLFSATVYLPFLCDPVECVDQDKNKSSPLVFSSSNAEHGERVVMVAMADSNGIVPVSLPRNWFKRVWGFMDSVDAETMLNLYLNFDEKNRCLVADGKYFRPEHLLRCVKAFEKHASTSLYKMDISVLVDYTCDVGACYDWKDVSMDLPKTALLVGRLWRCLHCLRLHTKFQDCDCGSRKYEYLRPQKPDGTIEYENGDHTLTYAPDSWCFTKRKHFRNGVQYDNPPMTLDVQFPIYEHNINVDERITWCSGESRPYHNSDVDQVANGLAVKFTSMHPNEAIDVGVLTSITKSAILLKTDTDSLSKHKSAHLRESLGNRTVDTLLDGRNDTPSRAYTVLDEWE